MCAVDPRADTRAAAATGSYGVPAITEAEFVRFRTLIQQEAGIHLNADKEPLLVGRLAGRLRELGLESFGAYYLRVLDDRTEFVELIDRICTNETSFFREPRQFQFLTERVFPAWRAQATAGRRQRRIRAWSAGCSTGEEPYSLAMTLLESFPSAEDWECEIHATDLSTAALKRARAATWPCEQAEQIPQALVKRFMLRGIGSQEGMMRAGPEIRSLVQFRYHNLIHEGCSLPAPFDLVLCRNVLIYFDPVSRLRVTHRLLDFLAPGGYLLLGHAESLHGVTGRAKSVVPTVYCLADESAPGDGEGPEGAPWLGRSSGRGGRQ
jgi:chemotaxis protein methyltransferase CheR